MSETYSVYNRNGTLVNETAICRVVKIRAGVYTWDIAGGSAASTDAEGATADDNYSVIRADITATERAGVPIEWAVDSAQDFFVVGVCGNMIIDGLPDSAYSFDAAQKVLWLECPFENAETWQAYIFRAEKPVNKFAVAEGRARISGIQVQFEKDNRVMRQIIAERFRMLRTPDTIKTLPPKENRAGKVLAFDAEGNPDLSVDAETVENVRKFSEDAQVAAKIADWAAKEASQASSVATEKMTQTVNAKAQTEELANEMVALKNGVEGEVAEFNAEAAAKLQAVQAAGTEAVGNVNTAKTGALAEVNTAKTHALAEVGTAKSGALSDISDAKTGAVGDVNTAKTNAVGEIATIKTQVETAGETAVGNVNTAKTNAVADVGTAKTSAVGEVNTAKTNAVADVGTAKSGAVGDINTAKTGAVGEVGTAKSGALSDIGTAKTSALAEITAAGASYQRQISENSIKLSGAIWPNASRPTSQLVAQAAYGGAGSSWLSRSVLRASAKFTVIGRYLPVSGEWKLFLEAMDEYSSGACLRVAADRKTVGWFQYYSSGECSYEETELAGELSFGDILTYVYDAGAVKIYKNKTLIVEASISDAYYLSGYIYGFCDLVKGINYKQNLLITVGNAFPLESDFGYSISDFVDGVPIPAGYFLAHDNINLTSFADGTAFSASSADGTYSQTFEGETGCAKFVPGGLHATTKRSRTVGFASGYRPYTAIPCKIKFKFYLPTTNVHWKYVNIYTIVSDSYTELTSVLDENNCAAAMDGWQTVEFLYFYATGTGGSGAAPSFRFCNVSQNSATREAISSAANDAFYISEYSIEYPYNYAIDNYVEAPTQNEVLIQKAALPRNMVVLQYSNSPSNEADIFSMGDIGANTVISTAAVDFSNQYIYLGFEDFDFVPFGNYVPKTLVVQIDQLSSFAADAEITFNLPSEFGSQTRTKADAINTKYGANCFIFQAKVLGTYYSLRDLYFYCDISIYKSDDYAPMESTGKVKIIWERIS